MTFLINPYRFGRLWTPAAITTALWLDAADSSTVTIGTGGVSQWNDKSGNGRNVVQGTNLKRPQLLNATINNLSVVGFDGVDDALSNNSAGLPVGASSRSVFVVYRPLRTTATTNSIIQQGTTNTSGSWFALQFRNEFSAQGDPYFAGFSQDLTDNATQSISTKIACVTYNGTTASLYKNGSLIASGNKTLNTSGNVLRLGFDNDSVRFANMYLAEIIYYSSFVSSSTLDITTGYLAWKWDLTASLPSNHPYKSAAPTT